MDAFIGKDEGFVKDWLVRQGLETPADVFLKVCFLNFRYVITCKHMNVSDRVNYILFNTVKTITGVNST